MLNSIISMKLKRFSVLPLIITNMAPLVGVLFFDWSLFHILFLYWLESGIIGFYNIFKMAKAGASLNIKLGIKFGSFLSTILIPFFILHYGGFMTVHLIFIFALFSPYAISTSFFPSQEVFISLFQTIVLPAGALFVSHGISFFSNFVGNREYEHTDIGAQMHAPYKRIIIMHVTLLFGGWLILLFKEPVWGLILLIVMKTITDISAHLKEHTALERVFLKKELL